MAEAKSFVAGSAASGKPIPGRGISSACWTTLASPEFDSGPSSSSSLGLPTLGDKSGFIAPMEEESPFQEVVIFLRDPAAPGDGIHFVLALPAELNAALSGLAQKATVDRTRHEPELELSSILLEADE